MSAHSSERAWRAINDDVKSKGRSRMAMLSCGGRKCADFTESGATFAEDCANATLAAAAPELLALAQRVAEYFELSDAQLGEDARRLIAKARGES